MNPIALILAVDATRRAVDGAGATSPKRVVRPRLPDLPRAPKLLDERDRGDECAAPSGKVGPQREVVVAKRPATS